MNSDFELDDILSPKAAPDPSPAPASNVYTKNAAANVSDFRFPQPGDPYPQKSQSRFSIGSFALGFSVAVGFFVMLSLVFSFIGGGDGVTPEPDVDPVDGSYVAIFYQDEDIQKYSPSQLEFLNSVNTANWLEEKKVDWQKIDEDDDISKLPKPFRLMAEKHRSKLPWIVIASGKKFASEPIESNEQAMKLLEKWIK